MPAGRSERLADDVGGKSSGRIPVADFFPDHGATNKRLKNKTKGKKKHESANPFFGFDARKQKGSSVPWLLWP